MPNPSPEPPREGPTKGGAGCLAAVIACVGATASALTLAYCAADLRYSPVEPDGTLYASALAESFALGPGLLVGASSVVGLLLSLVSLRRSPRTSAVAGTLLGIVGVVLLAIAYPRVLVQRRIEAVLHAVYVPAGVDEPTDAELRELAPRLFRRLLRDIRPDHRLYWKEGTGHPSAWRMIGRLWELDALSRAERDQTLVWSTGVDLRAEQTVEVVVIAPHHLPASVSHGTATVAVEVGGRVVSESKHVYDASWLHGEKVERLSLPLTGSLDSVPERFPLRVTLTTEVYRGGAVAASATFIRMWSVTRNGTRFGAARATDTSTPTPWW